MNLEKFVGVYKRDKRETFVIRKQNGMLYLAVGENEFQPLISDGENRFKLENTDTILTFLESKEIVHTLKINTGESEFLASREMPNDLVLNSDVATNIKFFKIFGFVILVMVIIAVGLKFSINVVEKFDGVFSKCEDKNFEACFKKSRQERKRRHYKMAIETLAPFCHKDISLGCSEIANLEIERGDLEKGIQIHMTNCDHYSVLESCRFVYDWSSKNEKNPEFVQKYADKTCDLGDKTLCIKLAGDLYLENKIGEKMNYLLYLNKACKKHRFAKACILYASLEKIEKMIHSCEKGSLEHCMEMINIERSLLNKVDPELISKACYLGNSELCK